MIKKWKKNIHGHLISVKKYSFTLIEILICLVLLGIIGSVIGYKTNSVLLEKRFFNSCKILSDEIKLTRNLSISYGIDIDLNFTKKNGKVILKRYSDSFPTQINHLFNKPIVLLNIIIQDLEIINFYSNNNCVPNEDLVCISNNDANLKRIISI